MWYLEDWLNITDNHLTCVSAKEMEALYLKVKEVSPASVLIEECLKSNNKHDFYFLETPRRTGKSWTQMQLLKERPEGKVGAINLYFDDLWYKPTKLLRSSSKQSRMVKVVCK